MRTHFLFIDDEGRCKRAGEGVGFALVPGRARDAVRTRVGSYPVRVRTDTGEVIEVVGPHVFTFSRRHRFEVEGARPGEGWCFVAFEADGERIASGGGRVRLTSQVQPATAAGTAAPVNGDASGFEVRPGTVAWTAYAGGVLQSARLWVQDVAGVWTDTGEDVDFTASPVVSRLVDSAGRVYLRSAAATLTLAVDVTEEVA